MVEIMLPSEHRARSLDNIFKRQQISEARDKAEQAAAQRQRDAQMRELFQQYGPGIASGDETSLGELAKIDPFKAQEARTSTLGNQKTKQEIDDKKRAAAVEKLETINKALSAVQYADPDVRGILYKKQRSDLARQGFDISDTPEDYDEEWVKTKIAEGQSHAERLNERQADPAYIRQEAEAQRESIPNAAARAGAEAEARARAEAKYRRPTEADRSIVTVQMPDGTKRSFRGTDPALDKALGAGAVEITKPSGDFSAAEAAPEAVASGAFDPETGPSDPTLTTGYWGPLVQSANSVADFFGMDPFDPETQKAAQEVKQLDIETRTMLQEAIPGRPSNYLLQELDALVAKAGGGGGPNAMRQRLSTTRGYINRVYGQVQAFKPTTKAQADKRSQNLLRLKGLVTAYDQMIAAAGGGAKSVGGKVSDEDALIQKWSKPSGGRAMDEKMTPGPGSRSTGGS